MENSVNGKSTNATQKRRLYSTTEEKLAWQGQSHIGTNAPKFVPSRCRMTALWAYRKRDVQILQVGLKLAEFCHD